MCQLIYELVAGGVGFPVCCLHLSTRATFRPSGARPLLSHTRTRTHRHTPTQPTLPPPHLPVDSSVRTCGFERRKEEEKREDRAHLGPSIRYSHPRIGALKEPSTKRVTPLKIKAIKISRWTPSNVRRTQTLDSRPCLTPLGLWWKTTHRAREVSTELL